MLRSSMDCSQDLHVDGAESRAGMLEKFLSDCQINKGGMNVEVGGRALANG